MTVITMRASITITLLALLALPAGLQAQSPFRVQPWAYVDDSEAGETETARLNSCVRRELRKLRDVELVQTEPDYGLDLPVLPVGNTRYAAAYLSLTGKDTLVDWILMTDSDLESLCKRVVARFDDHVLEPRRQFVRRWNELRLHSVQQALSSQGYYQGTADGIDGPRTRSAVRAFQATRDLPITGEWRDVADTLLSTERNEVTSSCEASRGCFGTERGD